MRNKSRRAPARRYGEPFGRAWESAILLSLLPVSFKTVGRLAEDRPGSISAPGSEAVLQHLFGSSALIDLIIIAML